MRWVGVVNRVLVGMILLVTALFFMSEAPEKELIVVKPRPIQRELPKSLFAEPEEIFQSIDEGILALKWVPPQMYLPDLRQDLIFYGKNGRPDSLLGRATFHLALKESGERALLRESERIYLVYQGHYSSKVLQRCSFSHATVETSADTPLWGEESVNEGGRLKGTYVFSPGNQPTPLWLEIKNVGEHTLEVRVSMLDEKGMLVTTPAEWRVFRLQAQEFPKSQIMGWELGGYRVDSTLLVRQKARWVGNDLFLEMHGGDDFAYSIGKERIDFLNESDSYSCFVGQGETLVWSCGRWQTADNVEDSHALPLLVVKKIEEKIMTFELWDSEGKGKNVLSLIKFKEHQGLPAMDYEMKFVGAKTWAQFIVENRLGERITLKLHDWLVLTAEGWIKLDTPERIDDYVAHRLIGPLFILDKMAKKNGHQVLVGHLFNITRTSVELVELNSSPSSSLANFYRRLPVHPPILPKPSEVALEGDSE
jgi:hypothetical protein